MRFHRKARQPCTKPTVPYGESVCSKRTSLTMRTLIVFFVTSSLLYGCSSAVKRDVDSALLGHSETGKASYYAMKYQFRKTASGARFNHLAMTAAHKKLPFGTKVRVKNLANDKIIVVTINDRGPFVAGRIIDLTRKAFSQIGNLKEGILDVEITVVR